MHPADTLARNDRTGYRPEQNYQPPLDKLMPAEHDLEKTRPPTSPPMHVATNQPSTVITLTVDSATSLSCCCRQPGSPIMTKSGGRKRPMTVPKSTMAITNERSPTRIDLIIWYKCSKIKKQANLTAWPCTVTIVLLSGGHDLLICETCCDLTWCPVCTTIRSPNSSGSRRGVCSCVSFAIFWINGSRS